MIGRAGIWKSLKKFERRDVSATCDCECMRVCAMCEHEYMNSLTMARWCHLVSAQVSGPLWSKQAVVAAEED